jgi:acetyltransferase
MPPLSSERAAAMSAVDFRDRFALVAMAPGDSQRMVGDCRLVPVPELPGRAEVAIAVADAYRDAGLGRALLERMLRVAGDRGCQVVADVRYDNARMMHLLRSLGFRRTGWELGIATFVCDPGQAQPEA